MYNNIMAAGLRDRPPMLATRRYAHYDMWIAIERLQLGEDLLHELESQLSDTTLGCATSLALVAAAQQYPEPYYQVPKSHKSYAPPLKQSSSTRSHVSTRHTGKEMSKPITPPFKSASEEDSNPEQAQRDKQMQK
ncbi:hypothetical protein Tco_1513375, partial [Tanacetum coccineum]